MSTLGTERTSEVRVCHNKWDGGLTLASDNQLRAGQMLNHCFFCGVSSVFERKRGGHGLPNSVAYLCYYSYFTFRQNKNVTILTAKFLSIFLRGEVILFMKRSGK